MTTYKGSSSSAAQNLFWTRGNMLASGSVKSGKTFSYKYDPNNLRYSKTVNGLETKYYRDGDRLVGEKTGAIYTQYIYAQSGIAGMIFDGVKYTSKKIFSATYWAHIRKAAPLWQPSNTISTAIS